MTAFLFALASLTLVGAAVLAVTSRDIVRAVLWLGLVLLATSAVYVTLDAGFLAAIQVLLYTGGIVTMMLFAVLLVRKEPLVASGQLKGGLAALAFVTVVASVILRSDLPADIGPTDAMTLGALLVGPLALPFEIVSVLLLAAMVAAIVLARRTDP